MKSIYELLLEIQNNGKLAAICTIVQTKGSTPAKIGSKMIVYENQKIWGTVGGGNLEKKVIENAITVMSKGKASTFRHDLLHQHNMCCGGIVDIFIEPVMKKNKLYIFGAGHTGFALAKYAQNFGFEIVIIDDRKEYLDEIKIEGVNKMSLAHQEALPILPFDEHTYICIMTYSHPIDREILAYCVNKPFAYLGMIGSMRKVEMTKKMFAEGLQISEKKLAAIDMPMGIDILAETPDEIAISILSKLISVKNKVTHEK